MTAVDTSPESIPPMFARITPGCDRLKRLFPTRLELRRGKRVVAFDRGECP